MECEWKRAYFLVILICISTASCEIQKNESTTTPITFDGDVEVLNITTNQPQTVSIRWKSRAYEIIETHSNCSGLKVTHFIILFSENLLLLLLDFC